MKGSKGLDFFSKKYWVFCDNKIESILATYSDNNADLSDVNVILELQNIKEYFDEQEITPTLNRGIYLKYKELMRDVGDVVRRYFENMTGESIVAKYNSCDVLFWDDFFELFYRYKVYEKIPRERFAEIIDGLHMSPNQVLAYKTFVDYFDKEIVDKLLEIDFGGEFFIEYFLQKHKTSNKVFLPKSLSADMIYSAVDKYISTYDFVSPKQLELVINGKSFDTRKFLLDDNLRYKAKKRYDKLINGNDNHLVHLISWQKDIGIEFTPECCDIEVSETAGETVYRYNSLWLKDNLDYPTLLNNFIYLFGYVDLDMRCSFTNNGLHKGIFDSLSFANGNGMYEQSEFYKEKNMIADAQMSCYMQFLQDQDIYLEEICKWFFEDYLAYEFNVKGFICNFPSRGLSYLEKCKILASAMDGAIKQYKMFVENGEIDRDLYEISSAPVLYSSLPSYVKKKYAYIKSEDLCKEAQMLFSNQYGL